MDASGADHTGKRLLAPNHSFWLDAIETRDLAPPLEGRAEAEVVLVGGGYTNLVAAYFLKRKKPDLEIALLESRYVGFGASGRNAGMVLHELHTDRVDRRGEKAVRFTYEQASGAVDLIEQIAREAGFDCELDRNGYFLIGFYPAHLRRLALMRESYRNLGVELPLLGRDEIQAAIKSERFQGALFFPRAAVIHPGKYLAGLKQAVKRAGVRIYENSPVTGVREGTEIEVSTPAGSLRAAKLVFGLNAYLPSARLGVIRDRAVSLLSFIILTEPLSDCLWRELRWSGRQGYSDLRRIHNYVRLTGRRILFGGRVLYHFGVGSAEQEDRIYGRLREELLRTFPCLEGVRITHRWCGPVAITWRRRPTLGRAGKGGNIYYALGYSGMGVSLGSLAGRVLADLVTGEAEPWKDLLYLLDRPWPLPPEPFRYLGFQGSYYGMRLWDALDRWRAASS